MSELEIYERRRKGTLYSVAGIILNALLATAKIAVGVLTGLLSVIADGVNNLSDCGSGVVSFVSFRISAKPADREHPYGHQRAEYVASMIIAFLVLIMGFNLFRESVEKLLAGSFTEGNFFVYLVLGLSILVKFIMFLFYRKGAKSLGSDTLKASAKDSACDCLATFGVLVGVIITKALQFPADGWAGIAIALFIAWQGIEILREASSKLLGQAPDGELLAQIKRFLSEGEGVLGLHDLRLYSYGANKTFATAHIEMDASVSATASHEIIDGLERAVYAKFGVELTAHFDPVNLNDGEARELEERVKSAIEGMVLGMNVHDFRVIRGDITRVVFEVGIPFSCPKKDLELHNDVCRAVKLLGDFEPCVSIERE